MVSDIFPPVLSQLIAAAEAANVPAGFVLCGEDSQMHFGDFWVNNSLNENYYYLFPLLIHMWIVFRFKGKEKYVSVHQTNILSFEYQSQNASVKFETDLTPYMTQG